MTRPAWRDDMLACYPYILARLKTLIGSGVRAVLEAQDFNAISSDERNIIPMDGAVYLIFDRLRPISDIDGNDAQDMEIGFSVILAKHNVTPNSSAVSIGPALTAIAKSLQGFEPVDERGSRLTLCKLKQTNPLSVMYRKGFAFFPLRFVTTVAIVPD